MLVYDTVDTVRQTSAVAPPVTAEWVRLDPPGVEPQATPVSPRRGSSHLWERSISVSAPRRRYPWRAATRTPVSRPRAERWELAGSAPISRAPAMTSACSRRSRTSASIKERSRRRGCHRAVGHRDLRAPVCRTSSAAVVGHACTDLGIHRSVRRGAPPHSVPRTWVFVYEPAPSSARAHRRAVAGGRTGSCRGPACFSVTSWRRRVAGLIGGSRAAARARAGDLDVVADDPVPSRSPAVARLAGAWVSCRPRGPGPLHRRRSPWASVKTDVRVVGCVNADMAGRAPWASPVRAGANGRARRTRVHFESAPSATIIAQYLLPMPRWRL
jgi:hypothetical protein